MKKWIIPILSLFIIFLSSCSVVTGIFKAGAYTGIIVVVIVLVIIGVIIGMLRKK